MAQTAAKKTATPTRNRASTIHARRRGANAGSSGMVPSGGTLLISDGDPGGSLDAWGIGLPVVHVPHRTLGPDEGEPLEIVVGRRRVGRPLQGVPVPGVGTNAHRSPPREIEVDEEAHHGEEQDVGARGRDAT